MHCVWSFISLICCCDLIYFSHSYKPSILETTLFSFAQSITAFILAHLTQPIYLYCYQDWIKFRRYTITFYDYNGAFLILILYRAIYFLLTNLTKKGSFIQEARESILVKMVVSTNTPDTIMFQSNHHGVYNHQKKIRTCIVQDLEKSFHEPLKIFFSFVVRKMKLSYMPDKI